MKKIIMISLTLILFLGLFMPVVSFTHVKGIISEDISVLQNTDTALDVRLNFKVALSNEAIMSSWPKLPTVEELWNSEVRCWIDTRDFGKMDNQKKHYPCRMPNIWTMHV